MRVDDYHRELTGRLRAILGGRLLGVYASGSFGLGDFDQSRSDLDVFAVCRGTVTAEEKREIVGRLRHEALPCPARGLEFVLYPEETARVPSDRAGFLLNLNTGSRIGFRVDEEPGAVARHWFPIDRAIVRAAGVALFGPPAHELFAAIPRSLLLPVVRESLVWCLAAGRGGGDAVLNACRSLRWLREGRWSSKAEAGRWALEHLDDSALVAAALAGRTEEARFEPHRVEQLVGEVLAELDRVAARG